MTPTDPDEPIAAPASAAGGAVRAVVRLSGPGTPELLRSLFIPDDPAAWPGRTARRFGGELKLAAFAAPVRCAALVWSTDRSYTGQPAAELHLPGSPPVVDAALAELYGAGFRSARPGEFTLRAFLAGRVGLTEAEAVLGVVDAGGAGELKTALDQLAGGVSAKLGPVREDLLDLLADLEAGLDFAEEDVSFVSPAATLGRIGAGRAAVAGLAAGAASRAVGGLPAVVLAGPPNAGKSSLLNALCGRDAALVSPAAGTTRDDVTAELSLPGVRCELVDTAGEESGGDAVSAAAQTRRTAVLNAAALVLHCVPPGGDPAPPGTPAPVLIVHTKADLRDNLWGAGPAGPAVSAATGAGLDALKKEIAAALAETPPAGLTAATAARGGDALRSAAAALERAAAAVPAGDEFVAAEVRAAVDALGEVLGVVYHDDLLGRIFGRFCIGK